MKRLFLSAVCSAAFATGASAATVDVDFVALVASIGEQGAEGRTFTFGGLDVTLTSTADAYLDGASGGFPAGLGVCSSGLDGASQCTGPGDEGILGSSEILALSFGNPLTGLGDFIFRDNARADLSGSSDALNLSFSSSLGTFGGTSTFATVDAEIGMVFSSSPDLEIYSMSLSAVSTEFYLSGFAAEFTPPSPPSTIPLPASILLLGGALAGTGAAGLKRRRASA